MPWRRRRSAPRHGAGRGVIGDTCRSPPYFAPASARRAVVPWWATGKLADVCRAELPPCPPAADPVVVGAGEVDAQAVAVSGAWVKAGAILFFLGGGSQRRLDRHNGAFARTGLCSGRLDRRDVEVLDRRQSPT